MVWMRLRKTRSAFIVDAVNCGLEVDDARAWWTSMYKEAKSCGNGCAEGSISGDKDDDVLWMAQTPMTWWVPPRSETDLEVVRRTSKTLTWLCRWGADQKGYHVDEHGGILVSEVLYYEEKLKKMRVTEAEIRDAVDEKYLAVSNRKRRLNLYTDDRGHLRVKAHQGHSASMGSRIDDDVAMSPVQYSNNIVCCHGTYLQHWSKIEVEGLKTFGRKHIHFSDHVLTSEECDKDIVIILNVRKWLDDGGMLYQAGNDVFLTEGFHGIVTPNYFLEVRQIRPTVRVLRPSCYKQVWRS